MNPQNLRIIWQSDQWTVERLTDPSHRKSKGIPTWKAISYHLTLHHALDWCINRVAGEALGDSSLQDCLYILNSIRKDLPKISQELLANPSEAE